TICCFQFFTLRIEILGNRKCQRPNPTLRGAVLFLKAKHWQELQSPYARNGAPVTSSECDFSELPRRELRILDIDGVQGFLVTDDGLFGRSPDDLFTSGGSGHVEVVTFETSHRMRHAEGVDRSEIILKVATSRVVTGNNFIRWKVVDP